MNQVIVKIKDRNSRCKYKKLLSTDSKIYEPIDNLDTAIEYNPNTLLEDDEWYQIKEFNTKKFSIDILENKMQPFANILHFHIRKELILYRQ